MVALISFLTDAEFWQGSWVLAALRVLLVTALQSTALLVFAWIGTRLLRGASAAQRHFVWVLVFGALLLLPAINAVLPPHLTVVPIANSRSQSEAMSAQTGGNSGTFASPLANNTTPLTPSPAASVIVPPSITGAWWDGLPTPGPLAAPVALLVCWYCGFMVCALRLVASFARTRRLERQSTEVQDADWKEELRHAQEHLGVRGKVHLRRANAASSVVVPLTWGWRHPVILLPAFDCPVPKRRTVLLHETAHIARGDWLSLWLVQWVCALYWFHPLVWRGARAQRVTSESATDDRVIGAGLNVSTYAEHLMEFRNALTARRSVAPSLAIGMAQASTLGERLTALLDAGRNRQRLTRTQTLGGTLAALGAVLTLARLGVAQEISRQATSSTKRFVTVRGRIQNAQGQPVAGASIAVYEEGGTGVRPSPLQNLSSDAQGTYALQVPDTPGTYRTLQIEHAGYAVKLGQVGTETPARTQNWTLVAPVTLSGTVTNESGSPLFGAKVAAAYFLENRFYTGRTHGVETRTDKAGHWTLTRLPLGAVGHIGLVAPGYASAEFDVKLEAGAAPYPAVKLQPGFEAYGRIVDANGTPVAGAQVHKYDTTYPLVSSDRNGNFVLPGLTARSQKIVVEPIVPNQFAPEDILVSPTQSKPQIRLLYGVRVRGRMVDAQTHAPIRNVHIENQYRTGGEPAISDATGRFEIVLPPVSNGSLTFTNPSYQYTYIFLNEDQMAKGEAGDVPLKRGTIWRGKVRMNGKAPGEQVILNLHSSAANAQLASDPQGNFQINALPSGTYTWTSDVWSWQPVSPQSITIQPPQDTPFVLDVSVQRRASIIARGRVVDESGHSLAYAKVHLSTGKGTYTLTTNSNGVWESRRIFSTSEPVLQRVEFRDASQPITGLHPRHQGERWQFPDVRFDTRPVRTNVRVLDADGHAASGARVLALYDDTSTFAMANAQGIATFGLVPQKARFLAAKGLNYGEAAFGAAPREVFVQLSAPRNALPRAEATVDALISSTVNSDIWDISAVLGDDRWRVAALRADGALSKQSKPNTTPNWNRAGAQFGLYLNNLISHDPAKALKLAPLWLSRIGRPETTVPFFLRQAQADFARVAAHSKDARAKAWATGWLNRQIQIFNKPVVLQSGWAGGDATSRYLSGYAVARALGRSEARRFLDRAIQELPRSRAEAGSYSFGAYFELGAPGAAQFRAQLTPESQVNFQGSLATAAVRKDPSSAPQAKAALEAVLEDPANAEVKASTKRFNRQIFETAVLGAQVQSLQAKSARETPRSAFATLRSLNGRGGLQTGWFALLLVRRTQASGDLPLACEIYRYAVAKGLNQIPNEWDWEELEHQLGLITPPNARQVQLWRLEAITNLKNGDVITKGNMMPDTSADARRLRTVDPALGRLILEAKWSRLGPLGANPNLDNRYDASALAKVMGRYDPARALDWFSRIPRGGEYDLGDQLSLAIRIVGTSHKQ